MTFYHFTLIAFSLLFANTTVFAQNYPSKAIRLLVPFGVGGPTDSVARAIASPLGMEFGQSVNVESKPGEQGAIVVNEIGAADADGYTLSMVTQNTRYNLLPGLSPIINIAGDGNAFTGIFGPKGLPKEVVNKINAAVRKVLEDPAVKGIIEARTRHSIVANSPEQFSIQMGEAKKLLDRQEGMRLAEEKKRGIEAQEAARRQREWENSPQGQAQRQARQLCEAQKATCVASCPREWSDAFKAYVGPDPSCNSRCQSVSCY